MKILAHQELWIWGLEIKFCAPARPTPMGVHGADSEWIGVGRLSMGAGSIRLGYAKRERWPRRSGSGRARQPQLPYA
jgi:hypothetical protein